MAAIILIVWGFFLLFILYFLVFQPSFSDVPFIPSSNSLLNDILKNFPLEEGTVIYDIGCGDARILLAAYKLQARATYIGVEKNWFPFLLAKFKVWRIGNPPNIKIIRKNMFDLDYSQANFIYVYLFGSVLDKFFDKFQKELRPGTVVLSSSFEFSRKVPHRVIILPNKFGTIIRKLYEYHF
jgi:SAM-dependent methyltransferase